MNPCQFIRKQQQMKIQENPNFLEKVGDRVLKICIRTLHSDWLKGICITESTRSEKT